jgi:putative phage-type endonuclease
MNAITPKGQWPCVIETHETEAEWLEARVSGIGASEVAAVFGCGYAGTSPVTVWASKTGGPRFEFSDEQLRRMNRGKKLEPVIASEFTEETGLECFDPGDYTIYRSLDHHWLFATLDRWCVHPEHGPIPVELKAVHGRFRGDWDAQEEPPLKYMVQVQVQMAVTGAKACYLVGLIGGDEIAVRLIERNQRFIDAMMIKLGEFWQYVTDREMPPVDESEATAAMLGMIYPKDDGTEVSLPIDFIGLDRELVSLKEQKKTIETRIEGIENRIKAELGNATRGILPVGSYSWKLQSRTGIDADLLRNEFPEVAERCSKVTEFRVLRRGNK